MTRDLGSLGNDADERCHEHIDWIGPRYRYTPSQPLKWWSSASNVMSDIQQPFLLLSFVVVGFLYLEHQYIPGERFESKVLFLLWCLVRLFGFHLPSSL